MARMRATYEFEINTGEIPAEALAEYLKLAEPEGVFNIWKVTTGTGEPPTLIEVVPITEAKS